MRTVLRQPPAGDQGYPSGWYAASHGCRPAYRPARAGLWCLLRHLAHAEHAGGAAVDPPAAAGHGAGRPRGLLFGPAAQAPRDRHPGEHRPGALVFEPAARHPLIAVSGGRGDGVSGAGAGARLDDRHVGRRLTLEWERLELSQFSRGEVDRREEARAAAVSEERLPCVAHAGPAGNGHLRPAGGEAGPDAESGVRQDHFFALFIRRQ